MKNQEKNIINKNPHTKDTNKVGIYKKKKIRKKIRKNDKTIESNVILEKNIVSITRNKYLHGSQNFLFSFFFTEFKSTFENNRNSKENIFVRQNFMIFILFFLVCVRALKISLTFFQQQKIHFKTFFIYKFTMMLQRFSFFQI